MISGKTISVEMLSHHVRVTAVCVQQARTTKTLLTYFILRCCALLA